MNKTIPLAAIAAAALLPAAAQAQGAFRADVHVGLDKLATSQRTDVGISGATVTDKDDGAVYGGEIGYDYRFGLFSLGAYAGIEGSSVKECAEIFTEVQTCAKAGRNITLGVRAGVNVTPGILIYAKGGYSNGQTKVDYIDQVTPANSFGLSESMDGYHLGGGVQVDVLPNVYAKLDYAHTDYSDYSLTQGTATISGGVDRDTVSVGVGMRF